MADRSTDEQRQPRVAVPNYHKRGLDATTPLELADSPFTRAIHLHWIRHLLLDISSCECKERHHAVEKDASYDGADDLHSRQPGHRRS